MKKDKFITEFEDIPKSRQKMQELSHEDRNLNFKETELGFTEEEAVSEAKRCLSCRRCIGCGLCLAECDPQAIVYDEEGETININADAVVLAPGSDKFNPGRVKHLGYTTSYNVITSTELERILSEDGPYGGLVLRPFDGEKPKRVAFIQCVGSREEMLGANFCSVICCMTALKESMELKKKLDYPEITIFHRDMRPYGKGSEDYLKEAEKDYGIKLVKSEINKVEEDDKGNVNVEYKTNDELKHETFDLVVLSVGMHAPADGKRLSRMYRGKLNKYGFSFTDPFMPGNTGKEGIFTTGSFTGPKDISSSITESCNITGKVNTLLQGKRSEIKDGSKPKNGKFDGKIGFFLCKYGLNALGKLERADIFSEMDRLSQTHFVKTYDSACVTVSRDDMIKTIREEKLDRFIVCSCYANTHDDFFKNIAVDAGLKPEYMDILDINTIKGKVITSLKNVLGKTETDLPRHHEVKNQDRCMVIGGGLSGITASLRLSDMGFKVSLIEKSDSLGGRINEYSSFLLSEEINPEKEINELIEKISDKDTIEINTGFTLESVKGEPGDFHVTVKSNGKSKEIEAGALIVASGASLYKPDEYLYGKNNSVITHFELEKLLSGEKLSAKNIVFIQCVGARNEERINCGRLCCAEALRAALKIKEKSPEADITILHKDIRVYEFEEDLYTDAIESEINFIKYENKPQIAGDLQISVDNAEKNEKVKLKPELIVLSVATVPNEDNGKLSELLKVSLDGEGYFKELHPKMRPVDLEREGIYVCGMAHYPKTIRECAAQAGAAAERAFLFLKGPQRK